MRDIASSASQWQAENPGVKFRGCFASPPFWKLECAALPPPHRPRLCCVSASISDPCATLLDRTYDSAKTLPTMAEHLGTWAGFVELLAATYSGVIDALEANSWIIIHAGPQRRNHVRYDMAFETQRLLVRQPF